MRLYAPPSGEGPQGVLLWDDAQAAGAIVVERAGELFVRVHHEGAVPGDRFADRQTAHDVGVERRRVAILARVGTHANRAATAEYGELAGAQRTSVGGHIPCAAEHIHQRVEVCAPRNIYFGTRLDSGVH